MLRPQSWPRSYALEVRIAFYDTGVGGLSTLSLALPLFPDADWTYVVDDAMFPAGAIEASRFGRRIRNVAAGLRAHDFDVILPTACVAWPHWDALSGAGSFVVDPVPRIRDAV